jgi:hypothetical protein
MVMFMVNKNHPERESIRIGTSPKTYPPENEISKGFPARV